MTTSNWKPGYTAAELARAQERYELVFPPDLTDLLLDRQPADGYDWRGDDPRIVEKLAWPLDMLLFDVRNGLWWEGWGERPSDMIARTEIVRQAVAQAPRLIPLLSHRFIPETPGERGNPIFSMHGFDTIYYGGNLAEYFDNEFAGTHRQSIDRFIPFWSDMVENHHRVVGYE